jgi:hypothetical protein
MILGLAGAIRLDAQAGVPKLYRPEPPRAVVNGVITGADKDEAPSGGRPDTSKRAFDAAVDLRAPEYRAVIDRPGAAVAIGRLGVDDFGALDHTYMRGPACDALA